MPNAVFPPSLPQRFLLGFKGPKYQPNVWESPTEVGPPLARQRATAACAEVEGELVLTDAEFATFEAFFVTTLRHGALPFDWVHPVTHAPRSFRFRESPTPVGVTARGTRVSLRLLMLP